MADPNIYPNLFPEWSNLSNGDVSWYKSTISDEKVLERITAKLITDVTSEQLEPSVVAVPENIMPGYILRSDADQFPFTPPATSAPIITSMPSEGTLVDMIDKNAHVNIAMFADDTVLCNITRNIPTITSSTTSSLVPMVSITPMTSLAPMTSITSEVSYGLIHTPCKNLKLLPCTTATADFVVQDHCTTARHMSNGCLEVYDLVNDNDKCSPMEMAQKYTEMVMVISATDDSKYTNLQHVSEERLQRTNDDAANHFVIKSDRPTGTRGYRVS